MVHFQGLFAAFLFEAQGFYPEELGIGTGPQDGPINNRLQTPAVWDRFFGPAQSPGQVRDEDTDVVSAMADVAPNFEVPNVQVAGGAFNDLHMLAMMIQSAGPNLTDETFAQGAFDAEFIPSAYSAANNLTPEMDFAEGDYTAYEDWRWVYWDSAAISPYDDLPGYYICFENCKRYKPGTWQEGDPRPVATGDLSKCAPMVRGTRVQQNVTSFSTTCVGHDSSLDNGGATAPGVTADTIKIIRFRSYKDP